MNKSNQKKVLTLESILKATVTYPVTLGFSDPQTGMMQILAVSGETGQHVRSIGSYDPQFSKLFFKVEVLITDIAIAQHFGKEINKYMMCNRESIPTLTQSPTIISDKKINIYNVK